MAPPPTRKGVLINLLAARKNMYNYQSSHNYHCFLFCCDRFRDVFKLPQFSGQDFDAALKSEEENFRAGSKALVSSDLIKKLVISLCRPWGRPSINVSNYNEVVHYVIEKRLVTEDRPNFLGPVETANVHALPSEVKIYLLNFLLDLRISKDESEAVDTFCDPTALRVVELGEDSAMNAYLYFGEYRVVTELKQKHSYHHVVDDLNHKHALWKELYDDITEESNFLISAETQEQWTALLDALEQGGPNEKYLYKGLKNLEQHELKAHLAELDRLELMRQEELKVMKKTEVQLRKELGLVRTSGRLQVKELEKKLKEEEEKKLKDERQRHDLSSALIHGTRLSSEGAQKAKTRAERHQHREAVIAMSMLADPAYFNSLNGTGNLHAEENAESFEHLEDGLTMEEQAAEQEPDRYLNDYTDHMGYARQEMSDRQHEERTEVSPDENQFELVVPESDVPLVSLLKRRQPDGSFDSNDTPERKKKRVSFAENQPTRNDDKIDYEPAPYTKRDPALSEFTLHEYYALFGPSKVKILQKEYANDLRTALVYFHSKFMNTHNSLLHRNESWPELEYLVGRLRRDILESRMDLVREIEVLVESISISPTRHSLISYMLDFAIASWDHLFERPTKEDAAGKEILHQLRRSIPISSKKIGNSALCQ